MIRFVHLGSWIFDPNPDFLPIQDPGSRGQKGPGSRGQKGTESRIRIRNIGNNTTKYKNMKVEKKDA